MTGLNDIELLLCVGALIFLIWKAARTTRPRRWWRLLATFIAVAALAGLILPLSLGHRPEKGHPVLWGPFKAAEGIAQIEWRRQLYTGEQLEVRGRWEGQNGSGPVKLLLLAFGTVVDSGSTTGEFSLRVVPAQTGRAVYRLVAIRHQDTLEQEAIPVEVGTQAPLRILVLAASPDFENVFLANWLAKNGQQAAVRTMVSRDKYQTSFVNMKPRPLGRITRALLDGFDVVIADEAVWTGPERTLLRQQVEKMAVGLIVRTEKLGRAPVGAMVFDSTWGENAMGEQMGSGVVLYSALDTSYRRLMKGQTVDYSRHWAALLRLVARPKPLVDQWSWEPAQPAVGDEIRLTLQTAAEAPKGTLVVDGRAVSVYLAEDKVLPFVWRGRYWPETAGWVAVDDSNWMYVWARGSWLAMSGAGRPVEPARKGQEQVPVPKYWMYTAFLLSIFFLWVEKKFN